MSWNRRNYE
jgi:hypothetical protein